MTRNNTSLNSRMYTVHGRKKLQGQWMLVQGTPVLAYTEGPEGEEKVVGYTTLNEMLQMAYTPGLREIDT